MNCGLSLLTPCRPMRLAAACFATVCDPTEIICSTPLDGMKVTTVEQLSSNPMELHLGIMNAVIGFGQAHRSDDIIRIYRLSDGALAPHHRRKQRWTWPVGLFSR